MQRWVPLYWNALSEFPLNSKSNRNTLLSPVLICSLHSNIRCIIRKKITWYYFFGLSGRNLHLNCAEFQHKPIPIRGDHCISFKFGLLPVVLILVQFPLLQSTLQRLSPQKGENPPGLYLKLRPPKQPSPPLQSNIDSIQEELWPEKVITGCSDSPD